MRVDRSGLTLLEVLIALAVLAMAAAASIGFAAQAAYSEERVRARAAEVQRASLAMAHLSLWPRERVAALGGMGPFQGFHVRLLPLSESLFDVTLADSAGGSALLRTALYLPVAGIGEIR